MMRALMTGASALCLLAACGGEGEVEDEILEAREELAEAREDEVVVDEDLAPAARSEAFLAETAARDGVRRMESGLLVETIEEGEGETPGPTDVIRLDYEARFADGRLFDSSEANGAPVVLPSYEVLQLPGLIEGVSQMKAGERSRFTLPAELAFGEEGGPGVSPGEAMVFDVTLVEVIDPEDEARMTSLQEEEIARMEARRGELMAEMEEQGRANAEASAAYLAEVKARDGVTVTQSGLAYEVTEDAGDGESPEATDRVTVHYRGTLPDGTEFDSSYSRGEPATFGLDQVIAGWTEGVQLMDVGDEYRFYVPAELGYGAAGTPGGPIGPNQALIFDVELIGIEDPADAGPTD